MSFFLNLCQDALSALHSIHSLLCLFKEALIKEQSLSEFLCFLLSNKVSLDARDVLILQFCFRNLLYLVEVLFVQSRHFFGDLVVFESIHFMDKCSVVFHNFFDDVRVGHCAVRVLALVRSPIRSHRICSRRY